MSTVNDFPVREPGSRRKPRVSTRVRGESKTQQHQAQAADVNLIVERHAQTGVWDRVNPRQPMYGDFSGSVDLASAMELVESAHAQFMEIPPSVRRVADNSPVRFLEMMATQEGVQALAEAGLPVSEDGAPGLSPPSKASEPVSAAEPTPENAGPEEPAG